jgi:hypothetical protein
MKTRINIEAKGYIIAANDADVEIVDVICHAANYPRTQRSRKDCVDWQEVVLQALRGE